jgi:hypothetical protein
MRNFVAMAAASALMAESTLGAVDARFPGVVKSSDLTSYTDTNSNITFSFGQYTDEDSWEAF